MFVNLNAIKTWAILYVRNRVNVTWIFWHDIYRIWSSYRPPNGKINHTGIPQIDNKTLKSQLVLCLYSTPNDAWHAINLKPVKQAKRVCKSFICFKVIILISYPCQYQLNLIWVLGKVVNKMYNSFKHWKYYTR